MITEQVAYFHAKILPLFFRVPVAIVEVDIHGNIQQTNPRALQLIMPMAIQRGLMANNLLDVFDADLPELRSLVSAYEQPTGVMLDQHPLQVRMPGHPDGEQRYFFLTIEKMDENTLLFFFDDLTNYLRRANWLPSQAGTLTGGEAS